MGELTLRRPSPVGELTLRRSSPCRGSLAQENFPRGLDPGQHPIAHDVKSCVGGLQQMYKRKIAVGARR